MKNTSKDLTKGYFAYFVILKAFHQTLKPEMSLQSKQKMFTYFFSTKKEGTLEEIRKFLIRILDLNSVTYKIMNHLI